MARVRPAIVADAAAVARIDVECWRSSYAGVLPDKLLLGLSESEQRRVWSAYIARHGGNMIVALDREGGVQGFGNCGRRRGALDAFAGEVFTLYVAPDHQGAGFGRALLLGLFARLVHCRLNSAIIWVLRDNPARFFYERLGGRLTAHRPLRVAGATIEGVAYGWPDLAALLKTHSRTGEPPSRPIH